MKRTASECSDNDVFFDDGDMLKDGSVIRINFVLLLLDHRENNQLAFFANCQWPIQCMGLSHAFYEIYTDTK